MFVFCLLVILANKWLIKISDCLMLNVIALKTHTICELLRFHPHFTEIYCLFETEGKLMIKMPAINRAKGSLLIKSLYNVRECLLYLINAWCSLFNLFYINAGIKSALQLI